MKKLLLGLFAFLGIGLINFSSAGSYIYSGSSSYSTYSIGNSTTSLTIAYLPVPIIDDGKDTLVYNGIDSISCKFTNLDTDINFQNLKHRLQVYVYRNNNGLWGSTNSNFTNLNYGDFTVNPTMNNNGYPYYIVYYLTFSSFPSGAEGYINFDYSCTFEGDNIINQSNIGGGTCDYSDYELKSDITENYCKNKFSNLMTSSECDTLYYGYVSPTLYQNCTNSLNSCSGELGVCNSNLGFCLNGNYSGDVQWSSLWINNIQHLGNKNIYIDIPEEINWDYSYTGDNMNIDIEGYNVDYEYMAGVIDTQNYQPTTEDLTNIFALFKEYSGLLVACLFVILFFYLIKKIF